MTTHADEDTLLRYRFDTLGRDQSLELGEHLRRCADCTARYAEVCRKVDALEQYTAEPEDPERMVQRALDSVTEQQRATVPETPAAKATPYQGAQAAASAATPAPAPEQERTPALVWLGVRRGARGRVARLAAAAALLLGTLYVGAGTAYYAVAKVQVDTHLTADQRWVAGGEATALVKVLSAQDSMPVEGADVALELECGGVRHQLARAKTGAGGAVSPTFKVPDQASGACNLEARSSARGERDTAALQVKVERQIRIHLGTDKPLYQPGQTIHIRALTLRYPSQAPAAGDSLVLEVKDPKGNRLTHEERKLGKFGVASLSFELADDVPLGAYTISATGDGAREQLDVKVDRYALPKFNVAVAPEADAYLAGETLRATVRARYFFGKPVARAEVHALLVKANGEVLGQEITGRTSDEGELRIQAELPADLAASGSETVLLQAQVKDAAGQEERREQPVAVSRQTLMVDVMAAGGSMSLEQDSDLFVLTSTPDGRPVAASVTLVDRFSGQKLSATTGARGVARLRVRPVQPALYDITAEAEGRRATATAPIPVERHPMAIQVDRALYRPGELVKVQVEVRTGAFGLWLSGIRDGQTVLRQQAQVRDGKASFEVALPATLSGSLELVASSSPETGAVEEAHASRWIAVAEPRALSVAISPDQPEYRPGTDAKLRFEVKDAQGRPSAASLGVAVVDESLFARSAGLPQQARTAFLLERALLAPQRGLSASELFASGDWTQEEQAAAAALFSLTPSAGPQVRSGLRGAQTLYAKQQQLALDRLTFEQRAKTAGFIAGLGGALAALAALLRARMNLAGRLAAAAVAGLGCLLAFKNPWFAGLIFLVALAVSARGRLDERAFRALRYAGAGLVLLLAIAGASLLLVQRNYTPDTEPLPRGLSGAQSVSMERMRAMRVREEEAKAMPAPPPPAPAGVAAAAPDGDEISNLFGNAEKARRAPSSPPATKPHGGAGPAAPPRRIVRVREHFPETMFVHPELIADERGVAELTVPIADSITAWRVSAFASSATGKIGSAQAPLKVFQDFFVDIDSPPALVRGDEAEIPVAVYNYLSERQAIRLEVQREDWFELMGQQSMTFQVAAGGLDGQALRIRALKPGKHKLTIRADGTRLSDAVARELLVSERGRQVVDAFSGQISPQAPSRRAVVVPDQVASSALSLKLYPTRTALALDGLEGSLRMPHGCFEQTSSTHYPNVLIYESLKRSGKLTPETEQRARAFISTGYQRLLTFEVPDGGFEWFGRAPANQVLTAYGLLELSDMARLFPVDPAVIDRTQLFLVRRQNPDGSWTPDAHALSDGLWRSEYAGRVTVTAYIAWALAESGAARGPLNRALEWLARNLDQTDDAYTDALAAAAFAKAGHGSAAWAARRLAARAQREETRVKFVPAAATAYYGRGAAAVVETTALAEQALLNASAEPELRRGALEYLISARVAGGSWGSTQATILALRALLQGAEPDRDSTVRVKVNGADLGAFTLKATSSEPTVVELGAKARRGQNVVELESDREVAYQLLSSYVLPWRQRGDEETEPLSLEVAYGRTSLRVGEVLPLRVRLTYRRAEASGMAMVQLGLPPGLTPVMEDLAALRTSRQVARYEPDARTISLYLDRLAPGAPVELSLRLKARGRVRTSGVESRAYLYYAPEIAAAAPPVAVAVN